jgi:ribosomal-protein-alanine N-acetyltransferase
MAFHIRRMEPEDIPRVSEIEREAFPAPWPPTNFRRDLMPDSTTRYLVACEEMPQGGEPDAGVDAADRDAGNTRCCFEKVRLAVRSLLRRAPAAAAPREAILGFGGVWFLADEAHLANFAVRQGYRRRGIGHLLLLGIIRLAIEHNAEFVTLEVRASNRAARALYEMCGFVEVGVRRGYYTDNGEDAILMTLDRLRSASVREQLERLGRDAL